MSSYRGTAQSPERATAIAAVIAVHVALALIIMTGLNVQMVSHAVEQLTTINLNRPPPRPRPVARAKTQRRPEQAKKPEGAPAKSRSAAPVEAPQPKLPLPSPVAAAKVASAGSAANSGAASSGNASGASGSGAGTGGGGYGDFSQFSPARLVSNIPNSEYRRLAATGIQSGAVGVIILVGGNGQVSNCRIARSSGDSAIDALVCQLTLAYVRFDPARDPSGRPVAQDITYFPSWRHR